MAQTIPDILINDTWQSINALTGIDVGTSFDVQKKGLKHIILAEGTQPDEGSTSGRVLTDFETITTVATGSLEIWARSPGDGICYAHISEN